MNPTDPTPNLPPQPGVEKLPPLQVPEAPAAAVEQPALTPPPAAPAIQAADFSVLAPGAAVPPVAVPPAVTPTVVAPQIADDVDVIEKEWVDKADEIRAQTKGDPHAEEEAEEILQQQYLKTRYGRDVGKPKDE